MPYQIWEACKICTDPKLLPKVEHALLIIKLRKNSAAPNWYDMMVKYDFLLPTFRKSLLFVEAQFYDLVFNHTCLCVQDILFPSCVLLWHPP
jgi:hypothetical protein